MWWCNKLRACALGVACWAISATAPCTASSLAPVPVPALAGTWQLFEAHTPQQPCTLTLVSDGKVRGTGCEAVWLGEAVTTWASKPDGVAFASRAKRTLLLLTPVGKGRYGGNTRQGVPLWLEKTP